MYVLRHTINLLHNGHKDQDSSNESNEIISIVLYLNSLSETNIQS